MRNGHLSNEASGRLLCEILHDGLQYIVLGHLSKENNTPTLAHDTVCGILSSSGFRVGEDISVYVAPADEPSRILEF